MLSVVIASFFFGFHSENLKEFVINVMTIA